MIRNQKNKQHRPKYFLVLSIVLAVVFSVIPMYAFADTGTNSSYVRIKNSWKPAEYLYEKNGRVVYGSPAVNDPTSHWMLEDFNGLKRIKNRATGHYINIAGHRKKGEGDYWNDPVKCSDWKDDSKSFLWSFPAQGDGVNLTNALYDSFNIHVEDQNGSAQCSDVPSGWGSTQWLFEKASETVAEVSSNESSNAGSNTNTDAPAAPVPSMGGDLAFVFIKPGEDSPFVDQSFKPWVEVKTYFNKSYGEHSSVYLKMRVFGNLAAKPNDLAANVEFPSYGYNYNVNDQLGLAAVVDVDGDVLADTQVLNSGYDWYYTFKNSTGDLVTMNMHNSPFARRAEVKLNTMVLPGLNLTLAYGPENGTAHGPEQYLAKFKYTGKGFMITGGYTNTNEGYLENDGRYNPIRPTYALSGTLSAISNVELYGEYMEHEYYLVKGTAKFDPFALKLTYSNLGYSRIGNPLYLADTVDCELDYALSAKTKIITGVAYYVNTDYDGLALATAGFSMGPFTLLAQHEYDAVILGPTADAEGNSYPAVVPVYTLVPNTTRLVGKYNLEGSNTLEAEYNLDEQIFMLLLHLGL